MAAEPRRILLVEDEMMVAMLVEDMLREAGHEVLGPVMHLDEAVRVARTADFDVAVLDVNLNGLPSFEVADVLKERAIPFVFATGYGALEPGQGHDDALTLRKPFGPTEIEKALSDLGFA